jgi:anti-sigma B factor antagonist
VLSTQDRSIPPLSIDPQWFGTTFSVRLGGELDLASRQRLEDALGEAEGAESVILDLEPLTFIDSSGLRVLYDIWSISRRDGFNFAIVGVGGHVRRVFELTGLDKVLPLVDEQPKKPFRTAR